MQDLKWSGKAVPAIGQRVRINFNELGTGIVEGYFAEEGYLGVAVKLDKEPDWHKEQCAGTKFAGRAHVFGVELDYEWRAA